MFRKGETKSPSTRLSMTVHKRLQRYRAYFDKCSSKQIDAMRSESCIDGHDRIVIDTDLVETTPAKEHMQILIREFLEDNDGWDD